MVPPAPRSGLQHPPLHTLRAPGAEQPRVEAGNAEGVSLPRGLCPGQSNPRNLGPVSQKPPRLLRASEHLGMLRAGAGTLPLPCNYSGPHQSRQPLISGSSWQDKGTALSPALCAAPEWDLNRAEVKPRSEPGQVGRKGSLFSKKVLF